MYPIPKPENEKYTQTAPKPDGFLSGQNFLPNPTLYPKPNKVPENPTQKPKHETKWNQRSMF